MSSVGNILLEKDILLESGTNEVEILVFRVGGFSLGINVAKVREVLPEQKITHLPKAHESVVGCFTLRNQVVPCVSLHRHLGESVADESEDVTIILTEFNQYQTGFVVDAVERIHRVSWEHIMAAPSIITNAQTPVTAVTDIENRLISMLDFEMIADQVSQHAHQVGAMDNPDDLPRDTLRILLADDSATVRQAVSETLRGSGYTNLTIFENGEEAWNWIQERFAETGDIHEVADLLVSDVEMPRVDGMRLTKNIKEHPELKKLYVLLYSSILTPDNLKKGAAVKANAMITKPQLDQVLVLADEMITNRLNGSDTITFTGHTLDTNHDPASDASEAAVASEAPAEPLKASETVTDQDVPVAEEAAAPAPASADGEDKAVTASGSPINVMANPGLWMTFRNELTDRVDQLRKLCELAADEVPSVSEINDAFRTLHSVKSAAMVVPLDEVTHLTHAAEGAMNAAREDPARWPRKELRRYVSWLRDLADPANDEQEVQTVLAESDRLQKEIAARTGS